MTDAVEQKPKRHTASRKRKRWWPWGLAVVLVVLYLIVLDLNSSQADQLADDGSGALDIHLAIAQRPVTLPLIALEDYGHGYIAFTLDHEGDRKSEKAKRQQFLQQTGNPNQPLPMEQVTITLDWSGPEERSEMTCTMMKRKWAHAVCTNPWSAIKQALPGRFSLVDLKTLRIRAPGSSIRCRGDAKADHPVPVQAGEVSLMCPAEVAGGADAQYYHAVLKIEGDLGAYWIVSQYGEKGEPMDAMTKREAAAITLFVRHALGQQEAYATLLQAMCGLRRPGAQDDPTTDPECGPPAPSAVSSGAS